MLTNSMTTSISDGKVLILLTLILTLLFGCNQKPEDSNDEGLQRIERAEAYHKQGQYRAAIIEARNAIKAAPLLPEPHIALARILNDLAQGKQALRQLDQIATSQRTGSAYQSTLTTAYLIQGKYRSALKTLTQSDAMRQEAPVKYRLLTAQTAIGLGNLDDAATNYEQVLASNPTHQKALLGLAKIHSQNNNPKFLDLLARLEQTSPISPELLLFKAGLAFKAGELDKTESLLTRALTTLPTTDVITPQRAAVLSSLSKILVRQGHSAEALIYTKLLAEAFPGADEAKLKYQQALEFFEQKNFASAENSLKQLLDEHPQMEQAAQLLGIIKYIDGDFEQANQYFSEHLDPETASAAITHVAAMTNMRLQEPEKVLQLLQEQISTDSSPQTLALYGIAALSAGKFTAGEAALLKAVQASPKMTRLRLALAQYYNSKQHPEPDKALSQLKAAYAQTDNDPFIQEALVHHYLQHQQKTTALEVVNEALNNYPQTYTSYLLAGDYYRIHKDLEKAATYYQQALTLRPKDMRCIMKLGLTYLALKDHKAAIKTYRKAIDMTPNSTDGYKGFIAAHTLAGDAGKALSEIIKLSRPHDISNGVHQNSSNDAHNNTAPARVLAEYYARHNDFEQAKLFEQDVIAIAPTARSTKFLTSAIAYAETSHWLKEKGFDQARQAAHRGLIANPHSIPLLRVLTQTEILAAKYTQAQKIIEQIQTFNQALADHLKGDLLRAQTHLTAAIEAYQRSWDTSPKDLVGSKLYSLLTSQNPPQASIFLNQWLEAFPNSIRALSLRSAENIAQKNFDTAIVNLEAVLDTQPNSPAILNNLAWAYHQTDNKKALPTAEKAYKLAPTHAAVVDTYGWILLQKGQTQAALKILRKAAALAPKNKEILQHLAEAESGLK